MLMGPLSTLLGNIFGKWSGTFALPLAIIAALTMAHGWKKDRDARLETSAVNECNSGWLVAMAKSKERAAVTKLQTAQEIWEVERQATTGLKDELDKIRVDYAELQAKGGQSADPSRCLSDSLLQSLGRRWGVEPSGKGR